MYATDTFFYLILDWSRTGVFSISMSGASALAWAIATLPRVDALACSLASVHAPSTSSKDHQNFQQKKKKTLSKRKTF